MVGHKLQAFAPLLCDSIGTDGNSLLVFVKGHSGSEAHQGDEICLYMASYGKDIIGCYFNHVLSTTPDHLSRTCMYNTSNWGTNAGLITASVLLQTEIWFANKIYHSEDGDGAEIRWSRTRSSGNNNKIKLST